MPLTEEVNKIIPFHVSFWEVYNLLSSKLEDARDINRVSAIMSHPTKIPSL